MDKFLELKTLLKKDIYLNLIAPLKKPSKNGGSFKALAIFGLALLFVYLGFLYFVLILAFIIPMSKNGESNTVLMAFFGFVSIGVIIFTSANIISKIYYSKDVEILLPLPIRRNNIYLSKILGSVIPSLVISFIIFVPMVFPLIRFANLSFFKFFSIIFLNLSNIIFTILILSIILILFMRAFAGVGGLKNLLQALGSIIIICTTLLPQIMTRSENSNIINENNLLHFIKLFFPQVHLFNKVYGMSDLPAFFLSFFILIAMTIILYALSFPLSKIMIAGVLKTNIQSSRVWHSRENKNTSIVLSLAKKDVINVLKTPVYFFNLAASSFMLPILILFSIFKRMENISTIQNFFDNIENYGFDKINLFFAFMLAVFFYAAFMTPLSLTSITREGKNIYSMQTLPISYEDQVNGRLLGSTIFQFASTLPIIILLSYLTKFNTLYILSMLIGAALGSYASSVFGIFFGIKYPKLNWENPQEAVKKNFTVFIFGILSMAVIAINSFIFYLIFKNLGSIIVFKFIAIVYLVLIMLFSTAIKNQAKISLKENLPEYSA